MKKIVTILILSLMIMLTACRQKVFQKSVSLPQDEWKRLHDIEFRAAVENPRDYDVIMKVVYDKEISQKEFAAGLEMRTPYGEERFRDVREKLLKSGQHVGEQNQEGLYVLEILYFSSVDFSEAGVYEFTARNLMAKFKTQGIHSVGLIIRDAK